MSRPLPGKLQGLDGQKHWRWVEQGPKLVDLHPGEVWGECKWSWPHASWGAHLNLCPHPCQRPYKSKIRVHITITMGHFKQLVLWVHSKHKWASRKLIQLQQFREYNPLQVWLLIATLPPTSHGTSDKSSLLSQPSSSHLRALELLCKAGCDLESENWASSLALPLRSGVTLAIT